MPPFFEVSMETTDINDNKETTHFRQSKIKKIVSKCKNPDCDYTSAKLEEHICPKCGWLTVVYGA